MQLSSPEQLTSIIDGLLLSEAEQFDLNRRLANRSRQYFRSQIRLQRDIEGRSYQKRARRKITLDSKTHKAKDNKNMLMGFSRALKTQVNDKGFEVGLAGVVGNMARDHNEGRTLSFTTRAKGYYNSRTSRWKGGTKVKQFYQMPKRTFIGWTPALERELLAMVAEQFTAGVES
ncbi:phage virion morphogenesis protein [Aliivibrio fischeri]|uniref:phage virion morphogenesis protein n=1 Tax=Aliivibrio fischeri TaxID=668 RepID=UPI0012DA92F6|nr:phage virion morphogenesis protein [Aliivibrio fischeri]MUJ39101.1 virion morphogenesis protein [Aliivibrio fischeri]